MKHGQNTSGYTWSGTCSSGRAKGYRYGYPLGTGHASSTTKQRGVGVRVADGWFKQPYQAESDSSLGLGEAAHLLHVE